MLERAQKRASANKGSAASNPFGGAKKDVPKASNPFGAASSSAGASASASSANPFGGGGAAKTAPIKSANPFGDQQLKKDIVSSRSGKTEAEMSEERFKQIMENNKKKSQGTATPGSSSKVIGAAKSQHGEHVVYRQPKPTVAPVRAPKAPVVQQKAPSLFDGMSSFYNNADLSDIHFLFEEGKVFYAHKIVMSVRGNMLETFNVNRSTVNLNKINMEGGCAYDDFAAAMHFVYHGRLPDHIGSQLKPLLSLLETAVDLDLEDLTRVTEQKLQAKVWCLML
jgi:hypothetical protein